MTQRWKATLPREEPAEGMAQVVLAVKTRTGRHELSAFRPGMREAKAILLSLVFNARDDLVERLHKTVADYAIETGLKAAKPYRSPWLAAEAICIEHKAALGQSVMGRTATRLMEECPGMFASQEDAASFAHYFTQKPANPGVILRLCRLTTQRKEDRIACTDWLLNEFHSAFDTIEEVGSFLDNGKF